MCPSRAWVRRLLILFSALCPLAWPHALPLRRDRHTVSRHALWRKYALRMLSNSFRVCVHVPPTRLPVCSPCHLVHLAGLINSVHVRASHQAHCALVHSREGIKSSDYELKVGAVYLVSPQFRLSAVISCFTLYRAGTQGHGARVMLSLR